LANPIADVIAQSDELYFSTDTDAVIRKTQGHTDDKKAINDDYGHNYYADIG